jgi:hypothetical protein
MLPAGVPSSSYGPRLASLVGLCSGAYRMSQCMVATFCTEVLGVSLALGEVCQVEQTVAAALVSPVREARAYVQEQDANGDETTWRQQQHRVWLWGAVTRWVSVLLIRTARGAKVLRELVGASYGAVLTSALSRHSPQPVPCATHGLDRCCVLETPPPLPATPPQRGDRGHDLMTESSRPINVQ